MVFILKKGEKLYDQYNREQKQKLKRRLEATEVVVSGGDAMLLVCMN